MPLLRILRQRARSIFRVAKVDAELQRELAFHLEQLNQESIDSGMDAGEARLQARRTMGGVAFYEEQCRDQRRVAWLTDLRRDVAYALGAHPQDVSRDGVRKASRLILSGSAIGVAAALLSVRLLESVLYGVRPRDPVKVAAAPLALAVVAILACLAPARRAARVDPMAALREE